jgi:hypothetical protein
VNVGDEVRWQQRKHTPWLRATVVQVGPDPNVVTITVNESGRTVRVSDFDLKRSAGSHIKKPLNQAE